MSGDLWLALDTATHIASVAVGTPDETRSLLAVRGARQHAAQIVTLVDQALQAAGARLGDVHGLVVGDGPGSFTGLRIGWAAAKGLAHQRGLAVCAVPSLLAWAAGAAPLAGSPIVACFDALRGQVYAAVYDFFVGRVETRVAPTVCTIAELVQSCSARPRQAVGDGAVLYAERMRVWTGADPVGLERLPPAAVTLLSLVTRAGAVRELGDPLVAEPVYGRPAEAQVKWEARHGRSLPDPSGPAR